MKKEAHKEDNGNTALKVTKRQKTTRAFERCQVLLHPLVWASPLTAWHLCWSMDNNLGSKEVVRQHVPGYAHEKVMLMKCYLLKVGLKLTCLEALAVPSVLPTISDSARGGSRVFEYLSFQVFKGERAWGAGSESPEKL